MRGIPLHSIFHYIVQENIKTQSQYLWPLGRDRLHMIYTQYGNRSYLLPWMLTVSPWTVRPVSVRLLDCHTVSLSGNTFVWPRFWGQRVAHLYWSKARQGEVGPQWSEASSQPSNINKLNIDVANAQLTINLSKPRESSRNRNCNEIGIGIRLEPSNDLVPSSH